ncbi:lytic murein transglycosylase [Sphaerisporangium sp. B11E5]|uniref:lytic transglycosylase domain-containing protein n=1 Tax=Sphaerisporangium sp. B11E5 TaxID=3153563 RepID=UPI00325CD4D9
MSRPGLMPSPAVAAGLAVLLVLGVVAGGVYVLARAGAGAPAEAARTSPAGVSDLAVPVTPFPTLTPPPSAAPAPSARRGEPVVNGPVRVAATPPRLIAVAPRPVGEDLVRRIQALKHVARVAVADGGAVRFSTATLNLLAVDPVEFRAFAPKAVAEEQEVWNALARGEFVAESRTVARYRLTLGGEYAAQGIPRLRVAASASLGLPGVDGLVGREAGRTLGLSPGVALLVHTPAAEAAALGPKIRRLLGAGAQVLPIGVARATSPDPTAERPKQRPSVAKGGNAYYVGRPGSYLDLYKVAAGVCPGLSWTVLAAIGQVESGHGRNNGPSSAGALGPMQFMPATWRAYGVDGDGDGKSDIWSPYDAVPGAARYLCANGAGRGGDKLRSAVYRYNHSWSYVNKVLGLSQAYARAYA